MDGNIKTPTGLNIVSIFIYEEDLKRINDLTIKCDITPDTIHKMIDLYIMYKVKHNIW